MNSKTKNSVHKIFIAAPIEKVWQQITKRDGLQAQFFNSRLDTPGLQTGAQIRKIYAARSATECGSKLLKILITMTSMVTNRLPAC